MQVIFILDMSDDKNVKSDERKRKEIKKEIKKNKRK
jgi:hypothetical protein